MENLSRDPVTIQSYLLLFNGLSLRSQDSLLWYCYFPFIFDCLRCGPTTFFRGKRGFFFFFSKLMFASKWGWVRTEAYMLIFYMLISFWGGECGRRSWFAVLSKAYWLFLMWLPWATLNNNKIFVWIEKLL